MAAGPGAPPGEAGASRAEQPLLEEAPWPRRRRTLVDYMDRAKKRRALLYGMWLAPLLCLVFGGLIAFRVLSPYLRIVPAYVHVQGKGWVRGITYPMARVYLGVPFGAAGRFEPPAPAAAWHPAVLDASAPGPACLHPSGPRPEGVSEDCLHLNVYTPKWGVGSTLNPVLVWLHGGGYTLGAGSDTTPEDAQELVLTHMMVVVTVNYRLGAFGFLGSEHLRSAKDNSTGNWGTQDQLLAMQWVHRHIRHFGGDPGRVTLVGWSAGAASISVHLTTPQARGLFQKAIMMSGGFTDWAALPMSAAESAFASVAECLGCPQSDRACLLAKNATEVMKCGEGGWYGPVVDGAYLRQSPLEAVMAGSSLVDYSVPVIIGCTLEDKLMDIGRSATAEKLRGVVAAQLGRAGLGALEEALALYPLAAYAEAPELYPSEWSPAYWAARQMFADRDFTCVMRAAAARWARQGRAPAYWYSWAQPQVFSRAQLSRLLVHSEANDRRRAPGSCYPCPGAGHGADLAFLFENPEKLDVDASVASGDEITEKLQAFDTNFVWSSDPDTNKAPTEANTFSEALPLWSRFSSSHGNAMVFIAGRTRAVEHYREAQCDFWRRHPAKPR